MLRKRVTFLIAVVVIMLQITVLFGEGYTAALEVMLVVNPRKTKVYAGSGKIVITADAPGKNLTFTWKLEGPGKLEGQGPAVFYRIPEKIEKEAQTMVSVTVKDQEGQETTAAVTFTILPKSALPPPEPKSTEKKGMSRTSKIALGTGAAAALGGGIALIAGGSDDGGGNGETDYECPESNPFTGTFKGTFIEDDGSVQTYTYNLLQDGTSITGTLEWSFDHSQCCKASVTVSLSGIALEEPYAQIELDSGVSEPCYGPDGCTWAISIPSPIGPVDGLFMLRDNCRTLNGPGRFYQRQ